LSFKKVDKEIFALRILKLSVVFFAEVTDVKIPECCFIMGKYEYFLKYFCWRDQSKKFL